jgi:O-antigen ligase
VPIGYTISAIVNKQNPILALVGHSNRNMGILTFFSILLILYTFSREEVRIDLFVKFALRPLVYISCLIGFIQLLGLDPVFSKPDDQRIVLFFGNSNFAASSLAIIILIPLFDSLQTRKKKIKIINYALFGTILFLGYSTKAVQFYAISILSIAIFFISYFNKKLIEIIKKKKYLLLLIASLGSLSAIFVRSYDSLSKLANMQDRLSSWKIGYEIFLNHPVFGVGVENFSRFQGIYKSPEQQRLLEESTIVDKAHNVFIDHFAKLKVNHLVFDGLKFGS